MNKKIFLFFMMFSFITPFVAFAESEEVVLNAGKVFKALLMSDKACVFRAAEFAPKTLKKGFNEVVIKSIPVGADINSFQVSVGENLRSLVSVEAVEVSVYKGDKIAKLEKNILELSHEKNILEQELKVFDFKLSFLNKTSVSVKDLNTVNQNMEILEQLFRETLSEQKKLKQKLSALYKTLEMKNASLTDMQKNGEEIQLKLKVLVEQLPKEADKIIVSYWEKDCGYSLSYNIRILPESDQVEIISFINVWQNTQSDWKDIALSIALADSYLEGSQILDKNDTLLAGEAGKKYFFGNNVYDAVLRYEKDNAYPGKLNLKVQIKNDDNYAYTKGEAKIFYGGNYAGKTIFGPCDIGSEATIAFAYQDIDDVSVNSKNNEINTW